MKVKVRACALWWACGNVYDIKKLMSARGFCDQHKYLHIVSVCLCLQCLWMKTVTLGRESLHKTHCFGKTVASYCFLSILSMSLAMKLRYTHTTTVQNTWMIHMEHNLSAVRFLCIRNQSSHVPQHSSPATLWAASSNASKIMWV